MRSVNGYTILMLGTTILILVLLVIVLIVGIGSIWMMRSLGAGPQAAEASTADQVVGSYLVSKGSLLAMGMSESILDVLQQSYVNEQVPLSDLRMNPFMPSVEA